MREIFQAYAAVPPDEKLFEENFKAIIDHLQKTHGFALEPEDAPGIRYVYEYFGTLRPGPDLLDVGRRRRPRRLPQFADLRAT